MGKPRYEPLHVRVGQVWKDNDPRSPGRTLRVERIYHDERKAACKVLTATGTGGRTRVNGTVRISLHRFKPRRNGYSLVSEPSIIGKSAEQVADDIAEQLAAWGMPFIGARELALFALFLRQHARDQRHLCAEAVQSHRAEHFGGEHSAAMNAPEPGMHNG